MAMNRCATWSVAALAEAYLDAVSRGEAIAAAERYFHPDVVYVINGPPASVEGLALPALSSALHSKPARVRERHRDRSPQRAGFTRSILDMGQLADFRSSKPREYLQAFARAIEAGSADVSMKR